MNFTRTKIICTIGPATQDIGSLRRLHKSGMNVARINMSHATHKSAKAVIDKIHKINNDSKFNYGKIGILLDTQGPEIRTGDTELTMDLKVGDQ
jgi:pyruvate kinase